MKSYLTAIVKDAGKRYTTYTAFAEKHGYPNAAVSIALADTRQPLINGESVTVLLTGKHMIWSDVLHVVEKSNGDQYIVGDAGLTMTETPIQPSTDELVSRLASLAESYSALEKRVSSLEDAKTPKPLVTSAPAKLAPKTLTRQDVIDRALKDVAELETTDRHIPGLGIAFWPEVVGKNTYWIPMQKVEYIVNQRKRTVVALIKFLGSFSASNGSKIYAKASARCTVDDVFNAHIGKAISLRRALGLAVPSEYTSAPQPTEPQIGDYVWYSDMYPRLLVTNTTDVYATPQTVGADFLRTCTRRRVIDDSRLAVIASDN